MCVCPQEVQRYINEANHPDDEKDEVGVSLVRVKVGVTVTVSVRFRIRGRMTIVFASLLRVPHLEQFPHTGLTIYLLCVSVWGRNKLSNN